MPKMVLLGIRSRCGGKEGITFPRGESNPGSAVRETTTPAVALHVSSHVDTFYKFSGGSAIFNSA